MACRVFLQTLETPRKSPAILAEWCLLRHRSCLLLELLNLPEENRRSLGSAARQRVIDNFELTHSTGMFLDLWRELAGSKQEGQALHRAA